MTMCHAEWPRRQKCVLSQAGGQESEVRLSAESIPSEGFRGESAPGLSPSFWSLRAFCASQSRCPVFAHCLCFMRVSVSKPPCFIRTQSYSHDLICKDPISVTVPQMLVFRTSASFGGHNSTHHRGGLQSAAGTPSWQEAQGLKAEVPVPQALFCDWPLG